MIESKGLFIKGRWQSGHGESLISLDPGRDAPMWSGRTASREDVDEAFAAAKAAFGRWSDLDFSERESIARRFGSLLERDREKLANLIGQETGKPLWDSRTEVAAMIGKIDISVRAYHQRTGGIEQTSGHVVHRLLHRPHGVVAVFGPYNFPGHLPNGHIVPALLAGNCVVFKPSEQTPAVAEAVVQLWQEAGLPDGVLNLVQGGKPTGEAVAHHEALEGLYFTGSAKTGRLLHQRLAQHPEKILALEMGGNNPLVVGSLRELAPAVRVILASACLSSGQRCTCARRLIVPSSAFGDDLIAAILDALQNVRVGYYDETPMPFMGCVISTAAASSLLATQRELTRSGGRVLRPMEIMSQGGAFITPGLIDVSSVTALPDEEYFGPLLQLIRYDTLDQAIQLANHTRFGLSAGILTEDDHEWRAFARRSRAGIITRNLPTTGASSSMPFGGSGYSGNHRPSAFYAADYCADPVVQSWSLRPQLSTALPQDIEAQLTPAHPSG